MNPGKVSLSGWLAPDGVFYPCEFFEHDKIVWDVTVNYYGESKTSTYIEDRGWIRLSRGMNSSLSRITPTQKQLDILYDLLTTLSDEAYDNVQETIFVMEHYL